MRCHCLTKINDVYLLQICLGPGPPLKPERLRCNTCDVQSRNAQDVAPDVSKTELRHDASKPHCCEVRTTKVCWENRRNTEGNLQRVPTVVRWQEKYHDLGGSSAARAGGPVFFLSNYKRSLIPSDCNRKMCFSRCTYPLESSCRGTCMSLSVL